MSRSRHEIPLARVIREAYADEAALGFRPVTDAVTQFNQKFRIGALRLGALIFVPLLLLTHPFVKVEGLAYEAMEVLGVLLIVACVLGRFWSILYVGRHKNRKVVTDGPYSMTRNPLYFFSTLGAFGVGLLFGKLTLALLLGAAVFGLLYATARRASPFYKCC